MPKVVATKLYRGSTADERAAQRRDQLISAAIELYGERGYHNTSVKALCAAAGLTERYFYESFSHSEELLIAALEKVNRSVLSELEMATLQAKPAPGERLRSILSVYFSLLKKHPQNARVFLVEIGGVSPVVDAAAKASMRDFADLLVRAWGRGANRNPLLCAGAVGGLMHIAMAWIRAGYDEPVEGVVDAAMRICAALGPPLERQPDGRRHRRRSVHVVDA